MPLRRCLDLKDAARISMSEVSMGSKNLQKGCGRSCQAPVALATGILMALISNIEMVAQTTSVDLASPTLRAHAQLPKYYRSGPPLAETLAAARATAASKGIPWKGLDFIVSDAENIAGFTFTGALQLYKKLTCTADTIIIGHTTLRESHLSNFGTVYTDYAVVIETLLKDNQKSSLRSRHEIVVTRPGGALTLNNDPVTFEFEGFPMLQSGTTYLLFLQYIPATSAYQAFDALSTLGGMGNNWVVARRSSSVPVTGLTRGVLEVYISNWLTSCMK